MASQIPSTFDLNPFLDPILSQEYKNPIICPHGHTLEENNCLKKVNDIAEKLIQCPFTGQYFPESLYRKNLIILELTEKYKEMFLENQKLRQLCNVKLEDYEEMKRKNQVSEQIFEKMQLLMKNYETKIELVTKENNILTEKVNRLENEENLKKMKWSVAGIVTTAIATTFIFAKTAAGLA